MNEYRYKAINPSGEVVEESVKAADHAAAVSLLADRGYVPIRPVSSGSGALRDVLSTDIFGGSSRTISSRDIMIATREIATLLDAGVELERALGILVELSERASISALFSDVLEDVRGGESFSEALDKRSTRFPPSYVSMVRAGETGGALDVVFDRLATYLENAHLARENLRSALIYPVLLIVMAVGAVAIMVSVVLPQFEPLFANSGKELPYLTQLVLDTSDTVEGYGLYALAGAVIIFAGLRLRLRDPLARIAWHRRFLAIPLMGNFLIRSDVARLCRTLGTLLSNGVPTLSALAIVRATVANAALAAALKTAAGRVQSGTTISEALVDIPRFPKLAAHLVRVGEETGRLENMLTRIADIYEEEAQRTIQRLLAILLPGLTALIGLFIATIIGSIFLAIVSINQLAF